MIPALPSRAAGFVAVSFLLVACGSDSAQDAPSGESGECVDGVYCQDDHWVCRPGIANDHCSEELTATVIAADGTQSTEQLPRASAPDVDCFYIYPTVALTQPPGNIADFSNLEDILVPLRAQAAPFSALCRVFAPFYHQITLATYTTPEANQDLDVAYADVEAAFETYLSSWNGGRDFILMGHSQGAHMLRRLLQRKIETDPTLRSRMIVAMPIGPNPLFIAATAEITVPTGKVVGGTFQQLPLCTTKAERGCVIAYDSVAAVAAGNGTLPPGQAMDNPCVNPAAVGSTELAPFRETLVPTAKFAGQFGMGQAPDLPTTFVAVKGLYSGACVRSANGAMNLQVSYTPPPGATLASPVNLATQLMHVLDYSFPLGDLLDVTQAKIAAGTSR